MSVDYQAQLMGYVDQLVTTIKAGANWTFEQLPDVAHQWVVYNMWKSGLLALFCALLLILAVTIGYRLCKAYSKKDPSVWLSGIIAAIPCVLVVMGLFQNLNTFLLCTLAPKVFLIQTLIEITQHATK